MRTRMLGNIGLDDANYIKLHFVCSVLGNAIFLENGGVSVTLPSITRETVSSEIRMQGLPIGQ